MFPEIIKELLMRSLLIIIFIFFLGSSSFAQNFDIDLLNKINFPPSTTSDKTWEFITHTTLPLSFATPITMFITGVAKHDNDLKIKSYTTGASIIITSLLTSGIKIAVKRERPFVAYPELIYKKSSASGYSFPSGHTSVAFATATSLSLAFPKWYVIVPAYTYAAAIGYSRMYLGVHYPTDVLAGILVGMGTSFLSYHLQKSFN